jgi:hypothetical protein
VIARVVARVAAETHAPLTLVIIADAAPEPEQVAQLGPLTVWLLDDHARARKAFGTEVYPTTFVFDRTNVVRRIHPGFGRLYERHIARWVRLVSAR